MNRFAAPPVSDADWRGLAGSVSGRVLRPADTGFTGASAPLNKRWSATPAGVVSVTDTEDVRSALAWVRETGVGVVVRGGGHSYGGYSTGQGLVLDLRALDTVDVDPSTGLVTVGGGASTGAVYAALQPHDLVFPLGNGDTVGVAGLALGGGSAAVSRKLGLTADTLVGTAVMTADGSLLECDEHRNTDLYWASRGGGGGNFGVTVSMTFQAQPAPLGATCLLLWDGAHAQPVFEALQRVMLDAPDELATRLGLSTTGDATSVSVVGLYQGHAAALRDLLAPVLATATPLSVDIADRTFWGAKDYLAHETAGGAFAVRTNFIIEPLPAAAVGIIESFVDKWPRGHNPDGGGVALFAWGGAVNRIAPADTAFVHRDAVSLLALDTSWTGEDPPETVAAHLRWLADLREALSPHTTPHAYQNFIDPELPDWRTAYYGANYPRLAEVKQRHDPENLFRHAQSITSEC
ncbi:FAD-binding protein [Umezawaea sp. Da 62-37]|uniref:FAD-dependent oxidoreductase n=1 Tax=Umezawaea sp. Da 62-37 TaxID=3075927 RepID=UPI0028F6C057|nr:FAD-binding protein [Umezawaea sp. Da 62-37]WNV85218.1 FAD-binding protein [Umezawaea sp. Da 62-37]